MCPPLARRPNGRPGFSLLELLVVIAIIAVLMSILLPVLSSARRSARAVQCLANLTQWSQAFVMYAGENKGKSLYLGVFPNQKENPQMWWERLEPYHPEITRSLLCPEATEPGNSIPHDAFEAWGPDSFFGKGDAIRGPFVGSYGFNGWLYSPDPGESASKYTIRLPAPDSSRIPVFFDSANKLAYPLDTDEPMLFNLNRTGARGQLGLLALERHHQGVHIAFLDGHVEHSSVPALWKLKWSEDFTPKDVQVRRR